MACRVYKKDIERFAIIDSVVNKYCNWFNCKAFNVEDTPERREIILDLHIKRLELFDRARELDSCDYAALAELREELRILELQLQIAWGFTADERHHIYWYQIPHCKCPILDNMERKGISQKIISALCPVHGQKSL